MIIRQTAQLSRLLAALLSAAVTLSISACALLPSNPAFVVDLPAAISGSGKRIAVVGDLQITPALIRRLRGREGNAGAQRALLQDLYGQIDDLSAVVIVGDLVFTAGSRSDWDHFDTLIEPVARRVPVLPAIGNHDYHCVLVQLCSQRVVPRPLRERFPWFSSGRPYRVQAGDIVLVFLDSETGFESQAAWLAETLEQAAAQSIAALVFFHRPAFSNSIDRGAHGDANVQQYFLPVLQSATLPVVVFNGHVHGYEHLYVEGVHHYTTAGGGGPRGRLAADRPDDVYTGRDCAIDPDGSVLRPFNYLLVGVEGRRLTVDMRGYCGGDETIEVLESTDLRLSE